MPCSLIDIYQYLGGMCYIHLHVETVNAVISEQQTAMLFSLTWWLEVVHSFKISVNICCNIPEDSALHSYCHGNLKPHYSDFFLSLGSSDMDNILFTYVCICSFPFLVLILICLTSVSNQ